MTARTLSGRAVTPAHRVQFPKPHFPLETGGGMGYTSPHSSVKVRTSRFEAKIER